jgi:hypothetical protein
MTEQNQTQDMNIRELRIAYVNVNGLDDEDIKREIAGSDHIVPVQSDRFYRASNYLYSGRFKETGTHLGIRRTTYDFLNQDATYIRNSQPQAEAIVLTGKLKGLVSCVELLGLPHVLEE